MDPETPRPDDLNWRWWAAADDERLAADLWAVYEHLDDQDRARQNQNLHHLRLYGNLPIEGTNPWSFSRVASDDRVTLNVVAACCDVAAARIGKQRPAAKILPLGGNHSLRRRSQLLERFLQATFRMTKVYEQTRRAFLDGAIVGTGAVKVYDTQDELAVERVWPSELLVDPLESLYGEPRMIFQRKWVPRDVLRSLFPAEGKGARARKEAVERAGEGRSSQFDSLDVSRVSVGDQVLVVEAWRLPSGKGQKDGRHAIVTDAGPLFVEQWDKDYLPFVFFRWKERPRGFWGAGIAEELTGLQIEINRLLIRLQEGHKRLGSPLVFIDARSKLQKNAMTNEVGAFVHYMGNPPTVATFQTAHPEIYQQLDRLWTRSFDLVGISQDTASPDQSSISGLSAQTQHEIGTERFSLQAQRYEELHIEIARQLIDRGKAVAGRKGGKFMVAAEKDKHTVSSLSWKDVDMEEDEYILQILPVSSLPQLPGPKLDRVNMMLQSGMVDPETARELLDFPDLESFQSLARAASDNIDRMIENMLDEGVYEAPEPFIDLRLALKKTQAAYNRAVNDGVPEDRLELLRDFMTETHRLMQAAMAEQMKLAAAEAAQQGPPAPGVGAPPATGPDGAPPMATTPSDGLA